MPPYSDHGYKVRKALAHGGGGKNSPGGGRDRVDPPPSPLRPWDPPHPCCDVIRVPVMSQAGADIAPIAQ